MVRKIGVRSSDHVPFVDNSFDVVSCFAVLHHMFGYESLIKDVHRVLKHGGIFYIDHDMDINFFYRFGSLVSLYRKFKDARKKYAESSPDITEEMYRLSEVHENGIDSDYITEILKKSGFSVSIVYHWYGLSHSTDAIFGTSIWPRGMAQLVAIRATKI